MSHCNRPRESTNARKQVHLLDSIRLHLRCSPCPPLNYLPQHCPFSSPPATNSKLPCRASAYPLLFQASYHRFSRYFHPHSVSCGTRRCRPNAAQAPTRAHSRFSRQCPDQTTHRTHEGQQSASLAPLCGVSRTPRRSRNRSRGKPASIFGCSVVVRTLSFRTSRHCATRMLIGSPLRRLSCNIVRRAFLRHASKHQMLVLPGASSCKTATG